MKRHEFDGIINKFGFEVRQSGDLHAWLRVDGVVVVRTKRSNQRGDLPCAHIIRQQLKLDNAQLRDAIACPLSRDGYLAILREKGVLSPR